MASAETSEGALRDPICVTPLERFAWVHGFLTGAAIGTGIFTLGLLLALWTTT